MAMFTQNSETGSLLDQALDAGALFEVHTEPMTVAGHTPLIGSGAYAGKPEKVVHYKLGADGTPEVLNVAHPSHPSSNYLQVLETAEAMFPGTGTGVQVLEGGRKMAFTQVLDAEVDLGNGDLIQPNLLWTASLDSSWATGAHGLGMRWFCTNQMPLANTHLKVRRTLNHDFNLGTKSAVLARVMGGFDAFVEQVSALRRIDITGAQFNALLAKLVPAPENDAHGKTVSAYERKVAAVRYYWAEEQDGPAAGTAWAAYNAVQSAEVHDFTKGRNEARKGVEIVSEEKHTALSARAARELMLV